ncbi:AMP-binding protein [Clostridium sp. SM-530-WT-3G]|uniref:AMP-binding protein n=1 Tax=Clostridium sp. SM-530-WT-3G TaxID=2725303 RepID=UPI00145E95D7|nr:AMP-binding protein [Clostridium sp. SM-530-WT-3G]NME82125.1 AMP-binding protein [Clostridium sp. SM-530-WT-3G]
MITSENTKTLYDLVQNCAIEYGDRALLRYEKDDLIYEKSYAEFALECDAMSTWIEKKNKEIGHRVHVGILGTSSYLYLTTLMGTVSAGGVAALLDVNLSKEDLADHLDRSDVDIIFYDWDFISQVSVIRQKCKNIKQFICIQHREHVECVQNILDKCSDNIFISDAKPEDCAIIIFTSGTTGRGKGVMLSHGNLIDNTFCTTEENPNNNEVCLNVLPMHHVFCLNGDILISMRYGMTVCLNGPLSKMFHNIQLFQPTEIRMVPMMAKVLYNKISITATKNPEKSMEEIKESVLGSRLHRIVSGGGYLPKTLADKFLKLGISIGQGYGMSECSPKISAPVFSRPDKIDSVGKVVDGCDVRIVDGEIQVKSPSVMMGYYKEPEKTAEAITEDGYLKTGDIGYVDDENFLYLTGRKKNLIILSNGENVSPELIENDFADEELIGDILVYGTDDIIAAEVYPNFEYALVQGINDIEGEIQKIISRHNIGVPSYKKIVRCTVRKNPFEKTSSKKIIREKYFDNKKVEEEIASSLHMPENDIQQKIYDSVAEVIGNSKFGIDSNLYECGLDSFGSVMLIEELHDKFEKTITFNDLMENNTVLKLEEFLNGKKEECKVDYSIRKVYPLTNMQKYFAYIIKGNTTGNLPFTFKLDNSIDLVRLKKAIEDTIDAHPGLKAIIKKEDGIYKVFRDDSRKIDIPIINLSDEEWELRKKEILVPFEYTADDNLFHIAIFKTETSKYLLFDVAHIAADGITMNILIEDVNKFYCNEPVEKESYTFYEYILDDQMREELGIRAKDAAYFDNLMDGLKMRRSILNKKEKEDCTSGVNAFIRKRFDNTVRKKILYYCKENGISENTIFLTAFNYCIGLFSDEKDVFCTSIHGGRTDNRWARLAGPLFLTYYFRFTQVPHERVSELLHKSSKQIMNTMRCFVSTPREGEMFFQFQGDIIDINKIGDAKAERIRLQLDSLPFHLQVMYDNKGYYYELRYWENRFDRSQLEIFLNCYESILNAMLEERSVRRLKKHLPESVYPKHYFVDGQEVNNEAGYEMLPGLENRERVKAYILDEGYNKKPYGAWGPLYIMNHRPNFYSDSIENPYGPGTLYRTDKIARILPDGTLDFLENDGRTVLTDGSHGRIYYDLGKLERTLDDFEGISKADAYMVYDPSKNEMSLKCNVKGKAEPDIIKLKEYIKEKCGEKLVPEEVCYTGRY